MTFDEICRKAIEEWGETAQLDQAIEEAAEFIKSINKFKRYNDPTNLLEEIADLEIMIGQTKEIIRCSGISRRDVNRRIKQFRINKLKRVELLLRKEEEQ